MSEEGRAEDFTEQGRGEAIEGSRAWKLRKLSPRSGSLRTQLVPEGAPPSVRAPLTSLASA